METAVFDGGIDQKSITAADNNSTYSNLCLQRSFKHINPHLMCGKMNLLKNTAAAGHLLPSIAVHDGEVIAHGVS